MATVTTLGFIGLGVMGEPMCRNLALKSSRAVVAYDRRPEPLQALARDGVAVAASAAEVVERAFAARGAPFADAPVARTAQAARDGTLSIMVGCDPALFERLRPLLACIGSEVTHCGPVGAGQAVKLMNNMVVAQTVVALAEALAVARASGAVDPKILFETLTKGSADSFVLRNHGLKALLPDRHPTEGAFPTTYIIKDLSYAIGLADECGLTLEQASTTRRLMERTKALGFADNYYTAVINAIARR